MSAAAHHPVDVAVGKRLRHIRELRNMSQSALGNAVSLTFQQIQKYENGSNRTSASRLYEFAEVLAVKPGYFFEGIPAGLRRRVPGGRGRRPT